MACGQAIWVASEAAPCQLQRISTEMNYGPYVCRVTNSGHTKQLSGMKKKIEIFSFHL